MGQWLNLDIAWNKLILSKNLRYFFWNIKFKFYINFKEMLTKYANICREMKKKLQICFQEQNEQN